MKPIETLMGLDRIVFMAKKAGKTGSPSGISDTEVKRLRVAVETWIEKTKTSRTDLGLLCGVSQPSITAWLGKGRPIERNATKLAKVIGEHPDFWRDGYEPAETATPTTSLSAKRVAKMSNRIGLAPELVLILSSGDETQVRQMECFSEDVRRAILGVVHVLKYPLESVQKAANDALVEHGDVKMPAEAWFTIIRGKLPARPPSGTHPSSGSMRVAEQK